MKTEAVIFGFVTKRKETARRSPLNTANWSSIKRTLIRMNTSRCLRNIVINKFINAKLIKDPDEGTNHNHVSPGVPQRSVVGPLLSNIM